MTLPKDITVVESPKIMAIGESRGFAIDFSAVGTPSAAGSTKAYDAAGTDVTSTTLTGTDTLNGAIATLKLFTPTSQQIYRLVHTITISGQAVLGVLDVAVFTVIPTTSATQSARSYGSLSGVASLVPRYASRGSTFDDTTRPVRTQLIGLIDQVSGLLNGIMAQNGFSIPVTQADVKMMLDLFVNQEVSAIVEGINGSGRFGPTTKTGGKKGRFALVFEDVELFVEANAAGFERLGAARTFTFAAGIGFRAEDESGETIFPIRQRKEFDTDWKNWDS